jgi:hypothetical protein
LEQSQDIQFQSGSLKIPPSCDPFVLPGSGPAGLVLNYQSLPFKLNVFFSSLGLVIKVRQGASSKTAAFLSQIHVYQQHCDQAAHYYQKYLQHTSSAGMLRSPCSHLQTASHLGKTRPFNLAHTTLPLAPPEIKEA